MRNKYCIVTPYYKEDRSLLERCIKSVREQTIAADHIMIADGFPQDWLDAEPVRHIKLDRSHGDYGNAARGLGALLAVAEKYEGIAFLDADNWYDNDHIETCLMAAQNHPKRADFVAAQRRLVRPDGSVLPGVAGDDLPKEGGHIDTNCLFFLPMAFHMIYRWCTIPQEMSIVGDRLFYYICRSESLEIAIAEKRTVNYTWMFSDSYVGLGETPPAGAKPSVNWNGVQNWLDSLSPEYFAVVQRLTGLHLKK